MAQRRDLLAPERLLLLVLLLPYYALRGLMLVVQSIVRLVLKARGARLALTSELRCPNGHVNATVGRYQCGVCHSTYHGWVGKCALCGAGAGWFECSSCGVGIKLPWERP
jgi:hypothetical protein